MLSLDSFRAGDSAANLTQAQELYRAGEFARCHESLDALPQDASVVFQRIELLFRERKYAQALSELSNCQVLLRNDEPRRSILLGAAKCYTGDFAAGSHHFAQAENALSKDDALMLQLAHHRGVAAWAMRDDAAAARDAALLEESTAATYRGLGLVLHSWIDVRRGDTPSQVKRLLLALDAFEGAAEPDAYCIAKTIYTVAALCRDIYLPKATRRLKRAVDRVRWSDGLCVERYQITRFLGWIEAVSGNELAAFRLFKQSAALAPSNEWKLLALLDRAQLARSRGEDAFALDELYEAHALASEINWKNLHHEERSALIVLAELFAHVEPKIATRYLQEFAALPPVEASIAYSADRRVNAFAAYSAGIAHKQLGNGAAALGALTDAWETFEQYSYGWRSALAAAAIFELTGARTWLSRAQHAIAPWPNSWIARKVARLDADKPPTAKLTSMQRRIYESLLAGHSTKDIAENLGRSPNTIRNHIAAVFLAFRVKSRAQLLSTTFALSNLRSAEQAFTQASA